MKNEIEKFSYQSAEIRTKTDENEQVWFAGVDVCNILGYADSHQTIMKLDEDERRLDRLRDGQGKLKETLTVNEFGLYSLILTSTKPEAKEFKRWVTHEVLPNLRRAGKYSTDEAKMKDLEIQRLLTEAEIVEEQITNLKSEVKTLTVKKDVLFAELRQVLRSDPNQLKLPLEDRNE